MLARLKLFAVHAWARIKFTVRTFATWEPAKWRGLWTAILAAGGSLGLGQWLGQFDVKVQAAITAASILVPYLQALWTRRAVSPVIRTKALEKALNAATATVWTPRPQVPGATGVNQPYPHQP